MDVNRRNLMKGVLTSGTLLALGIPPGVYANNATAGGAGRLGLLLGNTRVDAAFAAGIRTAYAAHVKHAVKEGGAAGHGAPEVVKLKGGLLTDYEEVARLLEKSRDTRWIAVMDDGSAAVFTELARNAGAKLLLLGSHVSSGSDRTQDISGDIPSFDTYGQRRRRCIARRVFLHCNSSPIRAIFPSWKIFFPESMPPSRHRLAAQRQASFRRTS